MQCYTVEINEIKTVSNVGGYNYKVIPGLQITVNTEVGGVYAIHFVASINPTADSEIYAMPALDGTRLRSSVVSNVKANSYTNLACLSTFTATSSSHSIAGWCGTSGAASIGAKILTGSRILVYRIG